MMNTKLVVTVLVGAPLDMLALGCLLLGGACPGERADARSRDREPTLGSARWERVVKPGSVPGRGRRRERRCTQVLRRSGRSSAAFF
jgi:hypothetical protein